MSRYVLWIVAAVFTSLFNPAWGHPQSVEHEEHERLQANVYASSGICGVERLGSQDRHGSGREPSQFGPTGRNDHQLPGLAAGA